MKTGKRKDDKSSNQTAKKSLKEKRVEKAEKRDAKNGKGVDLFS